MIYSRPSLRCGSNRRAKVQPVADVFVPVDREVLRTEMPVSMNAAVAGPIKAMARVIGFI